MSGAALAARAGTPPVRVTIDAGQTFVGTATGSPFPANSAHPAGGNRTYAYAWTITSTGDPATWSFTGQGTATVVPSVSGILRGTQAQAVLSCTVTSGGVSKTSAYASYEYDCIDFGGGGGFS